MLPPPRPVQRWLGDSMDKNPNWIEIVDLP
jgi:hypothetical protein